MALTRKFLVAMGIEADKIDEIIEAHAETVNALKAERDETKATANEAEALRKELEEAKKALEANSTDAFKEKYEALKKEFDAFKAEQDAKVILASKEKAYRELLKEAGISEKRLDAILKVTDLDSLELEGENLKEAEKLTESAKKDWADFIVTEGKEGAGTDNPPSDEGGAKPVSIPSIF